MTERPPSRVLVVDDEQPARALVARWLESEPGFELAGEAADGAEAVAKIGELSPDVVILDVKMPGMNGLEVIDRLGVERMPAVIFATAHDEHAVRAFEVHALDYLLKPFSRQRFRAALNRARDRERPSAERLAALLGDLVGFGDRGSGPRPIARLAVADGDGVVLLRTAEIEWLEAAGKRVRVHARGEVRELRESLRSVEQRLDPDLFLRVHRSAIVNLDHVAEIRPWFKGRFVVTLASGVRLETGGSHRARLEALCRNRPWPPGS